MSTRDKEIVRRRLAGETLASIAADVGLTASRVWSIARPHDPRGARRTQTASQARAQWTTRGRILIVLGAVEFDAAESLLVMLAAPAPLDKARFFSEPHSWQRNKHTARSEFTARRATVLGSLRGLVREGSVVVTEPGRYALSERVAAEAAA